MANEKRLIDANALMDEFRRYMVERYDRLKCVYEQNCKTCENSCLWRKKVSEAPTVDAVEVVHGHWIESEGTVCSVCNEHFFTDGPWAVANYKANYCPHCGAKMDGGNTEKGERENDF